MSFSELKVSSEITKYDFDEECFSVKIIATLFGVELFIFSPENSGFKKDWIKICDACKSNGSYGMFWDTSNGECFIDVSNGSAKFCVAKRGDGNGGEISINIPAEFCIDAFDFICSKL
jgi:hypothetical protein